MPQTIRKTATAAAALGALALGGSALADAATSSNSNSTSGNAPAYGQPPSGGDHHDPGRPGRHVGANGKTEQPLNASDAAKVKAAALKKVPGGTVERVETDVDHGSPFEAHVRKADGTELEVLVDKQYEVTAVNTMRHR
jgi:uncharacterized membrane protein YkoI